MDSLYQGDIILTDEQRTNLQYIGEDGSPSNLDQDASVHRRKRATIGRFPFSTFQRLWPEKTLRFSFNPSSKNNLSKCDFQWHMYQCIDAVACSSAIVTSSGPCAQSLLSHGKIFQTSQLMIDRLQAICRSIKAQKLWLIFMNWGSYLKLNVYVTSHFWQVVMPHCMVFEF